MKKWILPLMVIMMVGIVFGAPTITWDAPGTGSGNAVSGTTKIRITLSGDFLSFNATNATFFFSSGGTLFSQMGNATQSSCGGATIGRYNCTSFNYSWVTNPFSDAKQYYLRVMLNNASAEGEEGPSDKVNASDLSLVWIDNTNPTVSISTPTTGTTLSYKQDNLLISAAVVNTSSAVLYFGENKYTMTCTTNSTPCTYTTIRGDPPDGVYDNNVYVIASDGLDTTASTKFTYRIDNYEHGGISYEGATIDAQQAQQAGLTTTTTPPPNNNKMFIYIALGLLLWMVFKKR